MRPHWKEDDFSWIRGANYVPTYAANDVVQWRRYRPEVVEKELGFARRLGLNSVRTFLNILPYEEDRDGFLRSCEHFLTTAYENGLPVMIILWSSCFGGEPDIDATSYWVPNPGNRFLGEEHWPRLERYVHDVVTRYRGDERVLMWDVMNEPMAAGAFAREEKNRRAIWRFCRHFTDVVKGLDGSHPTTTGVYQLASLAETASFADVLSLHVYAGDRQRQHGSYRKLVEAGRQGRAGYRDCQLRDGTDVPARHGGRRRGGRRMVPLRAHHRRGSLR